MLISLLPHYYVSNIYCNKKSRENTGLKNAKREKSSANC
jgi:hypothetical protein